MADALDFEASNRKCSACGETGHNARTCKSKTVPFSTGGFWREKSYDGLDSRFFPLVDGSHVAMISKIVDGEVLKESNSRVTIPRITWDEEPITMTRGELDEMCKAGDLISIGESRYSCSYLRGALAYLPKNTVLTCYTGFHYPLKATFEYGGEEWILFLAPRVENWYAESFEAKGKGKSVLEIFSDNNAVLEGIWGGKDEWGSTYGHREVESFLIKFSPDMKSCELVLFRNLRNQMFQVEKEGFFLCGLVNLKDKNIWSWVQKGLYENPMWEEMEKLNDEEDSPLFKTMLKTYEKKLEEIGFENPRMDYYQEEGQFEMKFDSYTPVYCTSHDWGEAYVKDLSKDGVTFQQECSFCGITRRGYSDVKLDWDMEAESFEAVVVNRGPPPKGAVAKTMMNHAMMEKAKIEEMIQELENKVRLGIISEDQLMKHLEKKFGADYEITISDEDMEKIAKSQGRTKEELETYWEQYENTTDVEVTDYYEEFKRKHPEMHEKFVDRLSREDYWYGDYKTNLFAKRKELKEMGLDFDMIDRYWEMNDERIPERVTCSACDGEGIIITKYYPATRYDPADADYETCEMCDGEGTYLDGDYMAEYDIQNTAITTIVADNEDEVWDKFTGDRVDYHDSMWQIVDVRDAETLADHVERKYGLKGTITKDDLLKLKEERFKKKNAETKKRKTGFRKCSKCGYSDHNSSNCNRLDEYETYRKHKDEMLKECDDAIQRFTRSAKRYSEDGEYGLAKMLRSDATDMKKLKRMIENNHFGKAVHFAMSMDSDPRELAPSALWLFDSENEEVKLSKTSCCCGATESNPCACMKAPEPMNCSATEPKCQCYKDLEKNAETFNAEEKGKRKIGETVAWNNSIIGMDGKWRNGIYDLYEIGNQIGYVVVHQDLDNFEYEIQENGVLLGSKGTDIAQISFAGLNIYTGSDGSFPVVGLYEDIRDYYSRTQNNPKPIRDDWEEIEDYEKNKYLEQKWENEFTEWAKTVYDFKPQYYSDGTEVPLSYYVAKDLLQEDHKVLVGARVSISNPSMPNLELTDSKSSVWVLEYPNLTDLTQGQYRQIRRGTNEVFINTEKTVDKILANLQKKYPQGMISESDRGWRRTKSFSMIIPDFGQYMWTATERKLVYDSLSDEEKKRKERLESQKRNKEYALKEKEKQDALKAKYGAESDFKMYYLVEMPQRDYLESFLTLEDAQFAWKELPHREHFIIVERNPMKNKEKEMPRFGAESYRKGGRASKEMKKAILDFEKWWNEKYTPSNPSLKHYVRKPYEEGDGYGWRWCYYFDEDDGAGGRERLDLECKSIPYGNMDALNAWIRQTILMEKPSNFKDWHPIFDER